MNVTANYANVSTGSGDVVVNLSGKDATVTGGNGMTPSTFYLAATPLRWEPAPIALSRRHYLRGRTASSSTIFNGSHASLLLYDANDVAFVHGGTDTITDNSKGLDVMPHTA